MPWREMSPMEQRLEFVREYATELFTMTELAAQYGISRKTGYKWLERYDAEGADGLRDQSRRPHTCPHAIDPEIVDTLMALRHRHPRWGPKKLIVVAARREPTGEWPARSTVAALLKRRGLSEARRRRGARPAVPPPVAPIAAANGTWTTDFKGAFRTGDGVYCHPFTLRDGFSRYVLRCDALAGYTHDATRRCFERAFAEYGLPQRIRSDNGAPFAGTVATGLSRLSVWWIRLGIIPERIVPGHPEQNGSHEQFHAVLKAATARPPAPTRQGQQRRFDRFRREYNQERPHEALDDRVPAMLYRPSPRQLPARLPPLEYPGHFEVRRVYSNGCVWWGSEVRFLSDALMDQDIGFEEIDDGLWTVWFGSLAIGRYDERQRSFHPISSQRSAGRSASCAGSAPALKNGKTDV
jgi:transposase InsO family protein